MLCCIFEGSFFIIIEAVSTTAFHQTIMTASGVTGPGSKSPIKIFANIFISFIGAGVLGLPFAFKEVGVKSDLNSSIRD